MSMSYRKSQTFHSIDVDILFDFVFFYSNYLEKKSIVILVKICITISIHGKHMTDFFQSDSIGFSMKDFYPLLSTEKTNEF